MKITVSETRRSGGMAQYAYGVAEGLSGAGCDVTLICPSDFELINAPRTFQLVPAMQPWNLSARDGAGKVGRVAHKASQAARYGREALRMARAVEREKPDVALLGQFEYGAEGAYVHYLRARGVRNVAIVHETHDRDGAGLGDAIDRRLMDVAYRGCSEVLVHGKYNRDVMLDHHPSLRGGLHTIPFGNHDSPAIHDRSVAESTLRSRYGLGPDDPVILFFGSLLPSKGLPTLVEAFSRISGSHPAARLIIAGKPASFFDIDGLLEQIRRSNAAELIHVDSRYLPLEEVGALLRMCRVLALPYLTATQSGVLQLAYGQGTATVASAVGTFPEIIIDGESGLLVPPGDSAALATALRSVLDDADLAERLGARALELSRTVHSWPNVAREILSVVS